MGDSSYSLTTEGAVALSAAAAKTVLGIQAPSGHGIVIAKYRVAFDGVTASAVPVLVELCRCTFATNPPGTNSTTVTVNQVNGRSQTPGSSAAKGWTSEPTVLTVLDSYLLTPAGGSVLYDWPLGDEPDADVSNGFAIRLTAPAALNARATMYHKRL